MQFWPRKRARRVLARVRSWVSESKARPLGFVGYKAGMTHVQFLDERPKSPTSGEAVTLPVTIIECPPLLAVGIVFYKKSVLGLKKMASLAAPGLSKDLSRLVPLPKKEAGKKPDDFINQLKEGEDFDDLRLLVQTTPKEVSGGTKKPRLMELALGGKKEEKLAYAKEILGREIKVSDLFERGSFVDVKGLTKGKGFQGTVKRFGIPIRQHKAEKTKRGIGTLGPWTPKRVDFTVAHAGKMGYHERTEYNKQIFKVGEKGSELEFAGGLTRYGRIKNAYLLLKGSVMGPKKRPVVLTPALRSHPKALDREIPEIKYISLRG